MDTTQRQSTTEGVQLPDMRSHCYLTDKQWTWILAFVVALPLIRLLFTDILLFGGDEAMDLIQASLLHKGHLLYDEIWSNQPPLYTYAINMCFSVFGESALWPRLMSVAAAVVCAYVMLRMTIICGGGATGAICGAVLLIGIPVWTQLGVSAMQEMPMLALSLASVFILLARPKGSSELYRIIVAGILMGAAIEVKFTSVLLMASAVLAILASGIQQGAQWRNILQTILWYSCSCIVVAIVVMVILGSGSFSVMAAQHLELHARVPSGFPPPAAFYFTESLARAHWDILGGGAISVVLLIYRKPQELIEWFCLSSLTIFTAFALFYRPWWEYFFCSSSVPLVLAIAITVGRFLKEEIRTIYSLKRARIRYALYFVLAAVIFILEIPGFARMSSCFSGLEYFDNATGSQVALQQVIRNRGSSKWILTDAPIIAFHAGLVVPPQLAALPFKRIWAGESLTDRAVEAMHQYRPGLILSINGSLLDPFRKCIAGGSYEIVWRNQYYSLYRLRT